MIRQLKSHVKEESSLILEDFLNHGVDTNVQFLMHSSVPDHGVKYSNGPRGDDIVFIASLLDLVSLRELPNAKSLQGKLESNDKLWR